MARTIKSYIAKTLLVIAVVTLAAWWPARAWGGNEGMRALLWAVGVALLGALLGRLASTLVPRVGPQAAVQAAMVSLGVRLLATAAMALAVIVIEPVPRLPFAAWLGLAYAALLVVEVTDALASARHGDALLENGSGAAS
ncbi:MAG: hypothetical protein ACYTG6_04700 [Planctomycetota bacterium]